MDDEDDRSQGYGNRGHGGRGDGHDPEHGGDGDNGDDDGGGDGSAGDLVAAAREVQDAAHVPYSEYRVGAALRTADGTVYTGCNIENANYSNSLHAEEVALAAAVRDGHREFDALAVSSDRRDGVTPCGMCRQTLAEFCADALSVRCDEGGTTSEYTLGELLPNTISAETLGR